MASTPAPSSQPVHPAPRPMADATGVPDPDQHKGAVEGDRPTDRQQGNPSGDGVDDQGLPNDPVATAQDRIGANVDQSEGG